MVSSKCWNRATIALIFVSLVGLAACEGAQPTGVPFRPLFRTVAGNYRVAQLAGLPPSVQAPDGSDIRLSLGTAGTLTGRLFVPSQNVDMRLSGLWTFRDGDVIMDVDSPDGGKMQVILRVGFQIDRIGLAGAVDVGGTVLMLDLAKPRPIEDTPTVCSSPLPGAACS